VPNALAALMTDEARLVCYSACVAQYHRDGRIQDIADYCESDVVNTYRVWLRYELFRGKLTEQELGASEANLGEYIKARSNTKPHLLAYWDAAAGA
jgi:3'-5' exonuclease